MKHLLILILIISFTVQLSAQTYSSELSLSTSKIKLNELTSELPCGIVGDCVTGPRFNLNMEYGLDFNVLIQSQAKGQIVLGAGFNLWTYDLAQYNANINRAERTNEVSKFLNVNAGYRNYIATTGRIKMYIQNDFLLSIVNINNKQDYLLAVRPSLGANLTIGKNNFLFISGSFAQYLNGLSGFDYDLPKPHTYGLKIGVGRNL